MKKNREPKSKLGGNEVMINITAPNELVDGYLEIISGTLLMTNMIITYQEPCKTKADDKNTMITQFFILRKPPLGSLGLDDIKDCDSSSEED